MKLVYAFFATAAEFSQEGRFHILGGGIDALETTAIPTVVPPFALVIRLATDQTEWGRPHQLTVRIVGPNGQEIPPVVELPFTTPVNVRHPDRPSFLGVGIALQGLALPEAGDYTLRILADGEELGTANFEVIRKPEQADSNPVPVSTPS